MDHSYIENLDVVAQFDMTALHFAASFNHPNIIQLLLEFGANAEAVESRHGRTHLICASQYDANGAVVSLLDHGCNTEAVDLNGFTAYISEIKEGPTETAKIPKAHQAAPYTNPEPRFSSSPATGSWPPLRPQIAQDTEAVSVSQLALFQRFVDEFIAE
ncbi:ankyrin [Acephala macrosclerotiorum]|nr:ankyrin [Acephala macrosclerotiorum]